MYTHMSEYLVWYPVVYSVAYRGGGGFWGVQTPRPEIPKALQNCAELSPICENC